MTTRTERVSTPDGEFAAHVALPASGSGPGMLLIHEIFGVNDYVKDVAQRLAEIGYVVLAPDLYWRTQPGLSMGHSPDELKRGMAAVRQLDDAAAAGDCLTALAALRAQPEVADGRAGVIGFCLGGTLAFQVAIQGDPHTAVCYYGSGVADAVGSLDDIACPMILHYGGADQFIPREQIELVAAAANTHYGVQCHIHEGAGHAFDNHLAPQFYNPGAAAAAWELTSAFLARTLAPA